MPQPDMRGGLSRARRALRRAAASMLFAGACLLAKDARAASPYLEIPDPTEVVKSPAYRYANMSNEEAFAELDRRNVVYTREGTVDGVRAPIRLTGRLHGILIRSALPPEQRTTSVFEILDARLALALDDFTVLLAEHGVDEVIHYTMYRPNVPPPGSRFSSEEGVADAPKGATGKSASGKSPSGKTVAQKSNGRSAKRRASLEGKAEKPTKGSKKVAPAGRTKNRDVGDDVSWKIDHDEIDHDHDHGAKTPRKPTAQKRVGAKPKSRIRTGTIDEQAHGKWAPPGTRHPAGLAIDVGGFKMKDGRMLSVTQFAGKIGQQTCGAGAPVPESAEGRELRSIVCGARDREIFTYTLTPNYNQDHQDHFHMEIKPAVLWFLYH